MTTFGGEDGLWGYRFRDETRGFCPSCRRAVSPEPQYVTDYVDGKFVDRIAYWLLRPECDVCFNTLIVPSRQPRCRHYKCSRFVKTAGDYCRKHKRKPKPEPRRQGHCPHCGRFVPMNSQGRRRVYCPEPRRCRLQASRKRARNRARAGTPPLD